MGPLQAKLSFEGDLPAAANQLFGFGETGQVA